MTEIVSEQAPEIVAEAPVEGVEKVAEVAQERDEAGKFKNPHQPRIDELTRKWREQERETAYYRQLAEGKQAQEAKAAEAEANKEPTPDQFDDYNAYVKAQARWEAKQEFSAELNKRDQAAAEKAAESKRASSWAERVAETMKEIPDYDARMQASEVHVAPHVGEILLESDFGPKVAYHLDQNPELADKLNAMSPTAAAREIGRIEASLMTKVPDPEPADAESVAVTPKKAPPPPAKPLGSVRNTTTPLAKQGMDDYIAQRKSQGARWAR